MEVYCTGIAQVRHKTTGAIYEIESDELGWEAVGADERQMGPEVRYEAVVEHPELGKLTWSLWEYPEGIENYSQTDVGEHEVIEDFDYGLEHVSEPDIWVDYALPDDPFATFMDSYHRTGDLLADYGSDDGTYLLNRLIFSHQITALEAYLGDALMKIVLADKSAMTRLMTNDKEIAKKRFSLVDIAGDPSLVETVIREYLRSILYHNLKRVNFLYRAALGIRILSFVRDEALLFKAIKQRHDCVHRNGFDKEGQELAVFTKQYIQSTSDLIKDFVEKIEHQLRSQFGTRVPRA
jgi:hypothetical protein